MIQDKFSQELYGLDLKLEFSQPEFHPITSSRYFSLSQQKTATRSNGMKFRLEFSFPRKKSQDTPLLPMGKGERNIYAKWSYKKCRIRTNNVSQAEEVQIFFSNDNVSLSRSLGVRGGGVGWWRHLYAYKTGLKMTEYN